MNFLKKLLPISILLILVVAIGVINHVPDTTLTGWDNLHPELNLFLSIKRSIFSVWQEYQSLGLLGGMGHATDLVRQLFLLVLSVFLPSSLLRYVWTILTLFIGSAGMYFFTATLLKKSVFEAKKLEAHFLPLLSGLFYLLNLSTVQSFYVQFETFSAHFAFLPWMLLTTLLFFNKQSFKNAFILFATLFITTPQSYVPTLFVVYLLASGIILSISSVKLLTERRIKYLIKLVIKYFSIVISANAFWLLPFAYFTLTNASTNLNAKINQVATEQIILQNKEFGTIPDAMLLKGFWFNAIEPSYHEGSQYLLLPWRNYLAHPGIEALGFFLFFIILIGVFASFKKRTPLGNALGVLFIFTFAMLANATPPFSWLVELFRHISLFEQSFRFPFTKFSILASLLYSYFFAVGAGSIIELVNKHIKGMVSQVQIVTRYGLLLLFSLCIFLFTLPVFQGNLFYKHEQLSIPTEYTQLYSFFDKQDPSTRAATLPLYTFWSWNYYKWGYGGSGFLWYGIKQPIVDRAFDVWSKYSEGSYDELSEAIYSQDPVIFETTLNKFDITWLVLDKNIYSPSAPKSLHYEETEELLKKIPSITKAAEFGNIIVYKTSINSEQRNFLSSKPALPGVNSYSLASNDLHYQMLGDYKSTSDNSYLYPFRTLFSNKEQADKEFIATKKGSTYYFEAPISNLKTGSELTIPSLMNENILPVEVLSEKGNDNSITISAKILIPKVIIDGEVAYGDKPISLPLFVIPDADAQDFSLSINGNNIADIKTPSRTYISTQNSNIFIIENKGKTLLASQNIEPSYLISLDALKEKKIKIDKPAKKLTVEIPEVIDQLQGMLFTPNALTPVKGCSNQSDGTSSNSLKNGTRELISKNDSICFSAYAGELSHNEGYIITGSLKNISGRGIHFWILNENQGQTPIDTYFDKKDTNVSLIIAPREQYGKAYSLHFDNVSIGSDEVKNQIGNFSVATIPYRFLTKMVSKNTTTIAQNTLIFNSVHPNESLYRLSNIKGQNNNTATLTLSQSFDEGWAAYAVNKDSKIASYLPFVFGNKINAHIKVNNWANGWEVKPSEFEGKDVVIVYLPQYLEYVGFLLLGTLLLAFLFRPLYSRASRLFNNANAYFENKSINMKRKISLLSH